MWVRYMSLMRNIKARDTLGDLLVNQEYKSTFSLKTELQGKAEQINTGDNSRGREGAEENWVMDKASHEIPLPDAG